MRSARGNSRNNNNNNGSRVGGSEDRSASPGEVAAKGGAPGHGARSLTARSGSQVSRSVQGRVGNLRVDAEITERELREVHVHRLSVPTGAAPEAVEAAPKPEALRQPPATRIPADRPTKTDPGHGKECNLLCLDQRLKDVPATADRHPDAVPEYTIVPWSDIFDERTHGPSIQQLEDWERDTVVVFGEHESDVEQDTDEEGSMEYPDEEGSMEYSDDVTRFDVSSSVKWTWTMETDSFNGPGSN